VIKQSNPIIFDDMPFWIALYIVHIYRFKLNFMLFEAWTSSYKVIILQMIMMLWVDVVLQCQPTKPQIFYVRNFALA
jgi:fatty acid desaturase